jgi:hypothetical protein
MHFMRALQRDASVWAKLVADGMLAEEILYIDRLCGRKIRIGVGHDHWRQHEQSGCNPAAAGSKEARCMSTHGISPFKANPLRPSAVNCTAHAMCHESRKLRSFCLI